MEDGEHILWSVPKLPSVADDGLGTTFTSDNDILNGCPCYDDSNVEYTCPADMDTSSCFESATAKHDCGGTECYMCEDDSSGTMTGSAGAIFYSVNKDCSTLDYDMNKNSAA